MINTLIYYGLSMSSGSIVGNRYGNFILCSLVEIPALFLVIKIMNNCGRRESQCATLLVCSTLCISIAFVPKRNYYLLIYYYSASGSYFFPTAIRLELGGGEAIAPRPPYNITLCHIICCNHIIHFILESLQISYSPGPDRWVGKQWRRDLTPRPPLYTPLSGRGEGVYLHSPGNHKIQQQ